MDPFTLGVASGDPLSTSVILWTRLAIDPSAGGGMGEDPIDVAWEVGADDTFDTVVAGGVATAVPGLGHSLHIDADGLAPDTRYAYRFRLGDFVSPVGQTRTFPEPGAPSDRLRIGVSSCQNYEQGFYGAHRHLAAEDLDAMVWLGDYIYEYGPTEFPLEVGQLVRVHDAPEVADVVDYRNRYALYRSDPDLQTNHAAHPWIVTWDDHEVDNDYADSVSENDDPSNAFLDRRAAGYQAWYEHMPVRLEPPAGPDFVIYRDLVWGDLAQIFVLDGRQYRSDQPTDGEQIPFPGIGGDLPIYTMGPTTMDPDQRMLGVDQEQWFIDGMIASNTAWRIVAQQVYMHGLNLPLGDEPVVIVDSWDGYHRNRADILDALADGGVEDIVVLTGDFHAASVGDLKPDPYDPASPVVATEFMASSISSRFPDVPQTLVDVVTAMNPQLQTVSIDKGFTVLEFTPDAVTATLRTVDPLDPDTGVTTHSVWRVDRGTPGAGPA